MTDFQIDVAADDEFLSNSDNIVFKGDAPGFCRDHFSTTVAYHDAVTGDQPGRVSFRGRDRQAGDGFPRFALLRRVDSADHLLRLNVGEGLDVLEVDPTLLVLFQFDVIFAGLDLQFKVSVLTLHGLGPRSNEIILGILTVGGLGAEKRQLFQVDGLRDIEHLQQVDQICRGDTLRRVVYADAQAAFQLAVMRFNFQIIGVFVDFADQLGADFDVLPFSSHKESVPYKE